MKKEFWLDKWHKNQIGFHKDFIHPLLMKYESRFDIKAGSSVFVPLCGKSLDMLWLMQQGYQVVAVELSELAIKQFIAENKLEFVKTEISGLTCYQMDGISIYQADIFELQKIHLQGVKAVYDRAALIALPESMADKYVNHIKSILQEEFNWLLIVLEFDLNKGPPFSQSQQRIDRLFTNFSSVQLLRQKDILSRESKFKQDGCTYLFERVYLIKA